MSKNKYVALLRGVNVGGKAKVSMSELKSAMTIAGFSDVASYINSGNLIFTSEKSDTLKLSKEIQTMIHSYFKLDVDVVVISRNEWIDIAKSAPDWWGHNTSRKHNLIILLKPYDIDEVMAAIGVLKADIESAEPGNGVVYQSLSLKDFGKTTSGKLASNPIYKRMTIRNYNTTIKLLTLLD